jgi:hypothetical protein
MSVGHYREHAFCFSSMIALFRGAAGIERIHAAKDTKRRQPRPHIFEIGETAPTRFSMALRAADGKFSSGRYVLKTSLVQGFRRGFGVCHLHMRYFFLHTESDHTP